MSEAHNSSDEIDEAPAPGSTEAVNEEAAPLILGVIEGDRDATEEFWKQVVPYIDGEAHKLSRDNHADAEEIAQDSALRVFKYLEGYRGESKLTSWIGKIVRNQYLTKKTRKLAGEIPMLDDSSNSNPKEDKPDGYFFDVSPYKTPEEMAENHGRVEQLKSYMSGLAEDSKIVVVLKDAYDWSHAQIAEHLGITENTAKVRYHRAIKKMREKAAAIDPRSDEEPSESTLEQ